MAERTLRVFEVVLEETNPLPCPQRCRTNPLLVRYAATLHHVKLTRSVSSTKLSSRKWTRRFAYREQRSLSFSRLLKTENVCLITC